MQNFDTERAKRTSIPVDDRTFQIGGEQFVSLAAVHPSVLERYDALEKADIGETLEIVDYTITSMIEEEGHERYRALRERKSDPVTIEDLAAVCRWLISTQAQRPTSQSNGSGPGQSPTTTESTDGSPLPVTLPVPTG